MSMRSVLRPLSPVLLLPLLCLSVGLASVCAAQEPRVEVWRTSADRSRLLTHEILTSAASPGQLSETIVLDAAKPAQTIDGFGFAMTGGSAQLLQRMTPSARHRLLQQVFGHGPAEFGVSYLRVSIGASDMNDHVFTYDDLPSGKVDPRLERFSLAEDQTTVIPLLQEVLRIAPALHILASPWTAPAWMKTNNAVKGGSLRPEFYPAYAAYLVRYLQAMRGYGIPIDAVTMQNEPENPKNTPSMIMEAPEEAAFLRDAFGPALRAAGLKTRVILFDHNCDHPDYPLAILRDPAAAQFADGSGFHLYDGSISALSEVHDAFPAKNLYFTEQMVVEHAANGVVEPVARPVAHILIAAMRNWSRNVLLWNFAADPSFGPHTGDGGCPVCQGAVTLDGDQVTRNIALYTVAHASSFVPTGSVRIPSTQAGFELANVAWRTPAGKYVLLLANTGSAAKTFAVVNGATHFSAALDAGGVATFVW